MITIFIGLTFLGAPAAGPVAISAGPHLFVDEFLIERTENIARTIHPPARLPKPVITGPEDKCFQPYVSVVRGEKSGRFRIWYGIPESASQSHLATMESEDGIHWIRPHRVLADPGTIQFGVGIIDEGPAYSDPSKRFKYGWYHGGGLRIATSPDGLAWTPLSADAVLPHDHDINGIFRDPIRKRYIAMVSSYTTGLTWTGRRRVPMTSTSGNLIDWRKPWYAITPDAKDEGETQFYCFDGLLARGGLLIGMLRVLRDDLPADPGGPVAGIGYTVLIWSHDGETWERDRAPFLDRNPTPGSWDHAMTWIGAQIIVGDETFLYYGGYASGHKVERFTERQIGLARMRRDRYVSRDAGETAGTLRTRPIRFAGSALTVNADVEGELRVRLIDSGGAAIEGFDGRDADPIRGDSLAHPVKWKGSLASLRGKDVRIEFSLRRAKLYGFAFER